MKSLPGDGTGTPRASADRAGHRSSPRQGRSTCSGHSRCSAPPTHTVRHMHTHTDTPACTHTHAHAHTWAHTCTWTHTRAHTRTHTQTHPHARTRAHIHVHTDTRARTRTHTPPDSTPVPQVVRSCSRISPLFALPPRRAPFPPPPPQTSSAPRLCPEGPWPLTPAKPQCAGPSRGLQSHLDLLPAGWARSPARFLSDRRGAGVLNELLSSKVAVRGFSSCQLRNSKNRQRAGDTGRKSRLQRTRRPRPRSRNEK